VKYIKTDRDYFLTPSRLEGFGMPSPVIPDRPKVGDYVIACSSAAKKELINFIANNIGRIVEFDKFDNCCVFIEYSNVPLELFSAFTNNIRRLPINQILHYSLNREDLEIILAVNKYNI